MGLLGYFKPIAAEKKQQKKLQEQENEKSVIVEHGTVQNAALQSHNPSTLALSSLVTSPSTSRPGSIYPTAEFNDMKCDVMVNYLHQQQQERLWTSSNYDEGVVLKKSRGRYTCAPAELADNDGGFLDAIQLLNVRVAMTITTKVVKLFLLNNRTHFIPLANGLRLQVLPDISYLPRCQKHHFAAFIENRGELIVWDDDPRAVLKRAQKIEAELMEMIWDDTSGSPEYEEKKSASATVSELSSDAASDLERGVVLDHRPITLLQPFLVACTLALTAAALGAGWRQIAIEIFVDGNYTRIAFIAALPAQIWLGLFFFQSLIGNIAQLIGPVRQVRQNTKFYSGKAPRRLNRDSRTSLPHVTIQMPVYKEGLAAVIEPTIRSIKAAISTYEMQGGTANIFVNDDGMQILDPDLARARKDFYDEHNVGWTARPKHNPKPAEGQEAFLRRGKFKKASNMNYAMWVSTRVEAKLAEVARDSTWTVDDEAEAYRNALNEVVVSDEGRTWAEGNIRIGDYILIIDSDTRVPEDCFLDAVSEMEQCPQVAILQFASGVMNVTNSFFENGITFFTNLIYTQIKYAVASGDVAPFVGHNAILRWGAQQQISYECKDDHREKWWSEATVSEDFDMALRLQSHGYLVRLAGYTGRGFQEGVSLTVYDELARWEKYAYGCSELVFHPIRYWIFRGPFTPLFRDFICSCIPFGSKCTILAYIGTYYALASAWILTLANYFLIGWFNGYLDHYYIDSFKIYFSIIIVFTALGNTCFAVLRYRIEEKSFFGAFIENFKWIPLLSIFLGGVSLHVSQAILSHLFSIDMSWGATAKEVENTTFFQELPKLLRKFKFTFIFCIGAAAMMIVMSKFVPDFWQIKLLIAIWPLGTVVVSHFLLPVALNPSLMLFTW